MESNFTFTANGPRASGHDDNERPRPGQVRAASESPPPPQFQALRGAHTLSLSSIYNSKAAANRLPVELIVNILLSGAWTEWHELLPLTHICQRWRAVARGTPRLWADAVLSAFKASQDHIRCLPTLLEWSAPYPLRLTICSVPRVGQSAVLEPHFDILDPHFSRISYLSVDIACTANVIAVLDAARSDMRSLESLRIKQVFDSLVTVDDRVALDDSDLPLLRTLYFPAFLFTEAVAVKSLKSITVDDATQSHHIFLAALGRCALGLESLEIESWAHPSWVIDGADSVFPTVRLPSLRYLKITMSSYSTDSPACFIPGLSMPPDVRIDLNWAYVHDRSTRELLPRHLVGLNAPPFFDAICVYITGTFNAVITNCFVGGTERLCVEEDMCSPERLPAILDEYMSPDVTELAVCLGFDNPTETFINGDHLRRFVAGFPNLLRLDLLGKTVLDVKLQLAEAFLDTLSYACTGGPGAPRAPSTLPRCLALALEVEERPPDPKHAVPEEHGYFYSADHQTMLLRHQLDQLEALLLSHSARLHRLELCITISRIVPRDMLKAQYYRIADVPPSSHWARQLSWFYLPRFQVLVDDVVFLGDTGSSVQRVLGGTVRPLTGPTACS
ncbi:hypothetical protein GSI_04572 [Ganoderma sinense ZZ0214-1]|uniref:Uncharacterized protein n=1 Tax=Ganoderma sinense ZZ0214-1 TaxID=1077348 RepID=A0A2G8SH86_9APHY|nr:hypothetical protein GSI_04572 [Ganoderma sinense ZZ0214-1]